MIVVKCGFHSDLDCLSSSSRVFRKLFKLMPTNMWKVRGVVKWVLKFSGDVFEAHVE
jgi:hypothetical protein